MYNVWLHCYRGNQFVSLGPNALALIKAEAIVEIPGLIRLATLPNHFQHKRENSIMDINAIMNLPDYDADEMDPIESGAAMEEVIHKNFKEPLVSPLRMISYGCVSISSNVLILINLSLCLFNIKI